MFGPHTTGNRESAQRYPLLNAWRDLSDLALANQEALEKEMRRESWGGPHGIYTERWKKAQPAILQGKAWAGIASKGFIPSRWESGDSTYLEIYEGNLYQGEEEPPRVVETLWLKSTEFPEEGIARSGHSKSGVSGSFYPRVAFKLSNGKVVSERIRISDHGQVSERAPRRYSIDLRVHGEDLARRAFRKIIEANKARVWAGIDDLVAEEWEISREQTQKRQSRPLTGQAGESRQEMLGSAPSKTGASDNRTNPEEVNTLSKASTSPSLPVSESPPLPPKTALKLYRTLSAKSERTIPQQKALERAERSLGQLFLFDQPNKTLKPAEDLVLEQQTASRATFADSTPEQLRLFMASKAGIQPLSASQRLSDRLTPAIRINGVLYTDGVTHWDIMESYVWRHKIPAWQRDEAESLDLARDWIEKNWEDFHSTVEEGFAEDGKFLSREVAFKKLLRSPEGPTLKQYVRDSGGAGRTWLDSGDLDYLSGLPVSSNPPLASSPRIRAAAATYLSLIHI